MPKPPALPPGVEVGEFFSGAQTPLIWLSVPWFSLRTLDFKVLRNSVTSFFFFNFRTCGLRAIDFFLVLFAFKTFSLLIFYHSTIFSCRSSNISRSDINVKEKNCHLILHPAGFVFDNYVNSTCKYLGGDEKNLTTDYVDFMPLLTENIWY